MPHADRLPPRAARCISLALLTCILAACGGGDGGSSTPATSTTPTTPTTPAPPATPDTTVKPEMRCAP